MDENAQLKLQAYLDGELAEDERREVETWLARDAEAAALLAELRQTHAALADFDSGIKLPESREFYWSKIEREIQRQEQAAGRAPAPASWLAGWRRILAPASAAAALGLILVVSLTVGSGPSSKLEATFVENGAFTYRDQAQGMTLVWLSFPAGAEFTEATTLDDTLE